MKKAVLFFVIFIVGIGLAFFGLDFWLAKKIDKLINENPERQYDLLFENVDVNIGSVWISGEAKILSIDIGKSEEEEFDIWHTSELCSERFDFCIEWFSRCVCASVFKEVENGFVVILDGSGYGVEGFESCLLHFVVPLS